MVEKEDLNTIDIEVDPDFIKELSEYFDVLGSDTRLRILKLIENEPKDARTISNEIKTSYVNTKNHLDKLLMIGIIRKEVGLGKQKSNRRGPPPVWKYSLVPGGLEVILRSIGTIRNIRFEMKDNITKVAEKITSELINDVPTLRILGGNDDGKVFKLIRNNIKIGRIDTENQDKYDLNNDVILSSGYKTVTRVSKPHAKLSSEGNVWYIEDCQSKSGIHLNNTKIDKNKKIRLNDGDMIYLSKGAKESSGACLLFSMPKEKGV